MIEAWPPDRRRTPHTGRGLTHLYW